MESSCSVAAASRLACVTVELPMGRDGKKISAGGQAEGISVKENFDRNVK